MSCLTHTPLAVALEHRLWCEHVALLDTHAAAGGGVGSGGGVSTWHCSTPTLPLTVALEAAVV